MAKNNLKKKPAPIPKKFRSFEALADFWDSHDLTDYEDDLEEVKYKIAKKPSHQFILSLSDKLTRQMRIIVRREGVSMQTLVNLWIQERLQQDPKHSVRKTRQNVSVKSQA